MAVFKRTQKVLAGVAYPLLAAAYGKSSKIVFALHACPSCDTKVVLNKFASPACPTCATTMAPVGTPESDMVLTPTEVNELPKVGHCDSCDTEYHSMPDSATALAGHKIHCTVCASELTLDEPSMEDDSADMGEELPEEEMLEEDSSEMETIESEMEDDGESSEEDSSEDEMLEEGDSEGDDSMGEDDAGEEDPFDSGSDLIMPGASDEEDAPEVVASTTKGKGKKLKHNLFARVLASSNNAVVDLVMISAGEDNASTKWYMFANEIPVAVAKYSKASANIKPIFASDKFLQAFKAVAEEGMTEQNVSDFGFEPINVEVPITEATEQTINNNVAEAIASYKGKAEGTKKLFERCLGIASVGVNKGVFGDIDNTFRAALISKLNSLRVRNPESVVDSVLAEHGESLLRSIVVKATELTEKSEETLDEVADMVAQASYRASTHKNNLEDGKGQRSRIPFMASVDETNIEDETDIENSEDEEMNTSTPDFDKEMREVVSSLGSRYR